jgi:hypothetical protein
MRVRPVVGGHGLCDIAPMSTTPLPSTAFMYVESDVPAGMTLDAWRRRAADRPRKRRRRIAFVPGVERRSPLSSVLPTLRAA